MIKSRLRVLHLIGGNLNGGAARGAYWLHKALQDEEVESYVATNSDYKIDDPSVYYFNKEEHKAYQRQEVKLLSIAPQREYIFSTGLFGPNLMSIPIYKDVDIIHLHWVNEQVFDLRALAFIKKPIVWTIRDMWPMTGGCHYAMECERFFNGCGVCPQLNSRDKDDLSKLVFDFKKLYYTKDIVMVGISHWISNLLQKSPLFQKNNVKMIPNGIRLSAFTSMNKKQVKQILSLPEDKTVVLFGAQQVNNFYKGFELFCQAVSLLDTEKFYLCTFGEIVEDKISALGFAYHNFGFINDNTLLNAVYSAADMFVSASINEAFGKTLVEAMACGTPVVCFDHGGPADIVEHKRSGYKAKFLDVEDMGKGIQWISEHEKYQDLCANSRIRAYEKYNIQKVAKEYVHLYVNLGELKFNQNFDKNDVKRLNKQLEQFVDRSEYSTNKQSLLNFSSTFSKLFAQCEKLKLSNKKFALYGYGTVGQLIFMLMPSHISIIVDQYSENYDPINQQSGEVFHPKVLQKVEYDAVLISVIGREDEIESYLHELEIPKGMMVRLIV